MPIKVVQDDGTEVEAYTADEVTARETAKAEEAKAAVRKQVEDEFGAKLSEKDQEIETQRRLIQSKGKSIDDLKKIAEDKEQKFSETERTLAQLQLDAQQRIEQAEGEKKASLDRKRAALISEVSGGNKEIEKKLTDNYALINLAETDEDSIKARLQSAMKLTEGVAAQSFTFSGSGAAPVTKPKADNFAETEKGQKIYKRFGF